MAPTAESVTTPTLASALEGLPARVRVHELARRAGLSSKEAIAALGKADVSVASASSSVDREVAETVLTTILGGSRRRRSGARSGSSQPAADRDAKASSGEEPAAARPRRAKPEQDTDASARDGDGDPADSDDDGSGKGRRRRRRGGRGRRGGRATGDDTTVESGAEAESPQGGSTQGGDSQTGDDTADRPDRAQSAGKSGGRGKSGGSGKAQSGGGSGKEQSGGDDQARKKSDASPSADESGDDESDSSDGQGAGSRRRRRRRRRSGSGSDSGSDDAKSDSKQGPSVQGVKGSTRLEAKRQRRRDSRDARRRPQILSESEFLARRESVDRVMAVRQRGDLAQIALLEDGMLVEHFVSRTGSASMIGNVYLGRVQNVLPSMEAAFVDIGKGRNAVLYAGEVNWDVAGLSGKERRIEMALSGGDTVLVQVSKDPIGHKGARLTTQISLPGRFLVYVPGGGATGISRKLPDTERKRLKKILDRIVPADAGVIIRTAAEGVGEDELASDVARLQSQWQEIAAAAGVPVSRTDSTGGATSSKDVPATRETAPTADDAESTGSQSSTGTDAPSGDQGSAGDRRPAVAPHHVTPPPNALKPVASAVAPAQLYVEPDTLIKVIRDLFNSDINRLLIDGDEAWESVSKYVLGVAPELADRVSRYVGSKDVFAAFRIDEQITKALQRKVRLPSGGSLVIDRTEAMTVVDVNTGKFTGSGGNLEETVTRNNLEAAEEIVRQLRLRDIGGIIVVDFIDMVLESNRDLVLRRLTECLGRDRTRHQVAEVTSLGLVQMTRKRMGLGLVEAFSEPCEHCNGRGIILRDTPDDTSASGDHASHEKSGSKGRRRGRQRDDDAKFEPLVVERVTADAKPDPRGPKAPAALRTDADQHEPGAGEDGPGTAEPLSADAPDASGVASPTEQPPVSGDDTTPREDSRADGAAAPRRPRRRAAGRPAGAPSAAAAAVDIVLPVSDASG